jgi:hypothetical protein
METLYDPVRWLAEGRAFVERARGGKISDEYLSGDIALAYDVSAWPQPWLAADVLTYDLDRGERFDTRSTEAPEAATDEARQGMVPVDDRARHLRVPRWCSRRRTAAVLQ